MRPSPKTRRKLARLLHALYERMGGGRGVCWVCGSASGCKTAREGYAVRCRACVRDERHTPDTLEHERLVEQLRSIGGAR